MRALIFTFGTRGDVDPYVALASRLQREGHAVTLSAPGVYREDLERRGIRFEPMGDAMHDEMRALMADSRGPVEAATLARRMSQAMRRSLSEQWTVAQKVDPTVIVSHPKALAGVHIAERLGIPFVASLPLPFLTPTRDFAIPFVARRFPGPVNHLSYQFNRFTALAYGGMINRFRTQTLGMRRTSRMSDYLHRDGERVPVLYPFSPHVVPPPADYPDSAHITGYWFPENDSDEWTPPPALREFLEAGPAIYIGFGSMGFGKPSAERSKTVLEAVRHAGVRAVVAKGWGGLDDISDPRIHVIGEAPHRWLFPRVTAVVHHGGAGTTAAGLRAGRPSLICPVLGDQPFWGSRVHALGAGPRPLPLRRATAATLAARIDELVSTGRYADSAETLAQSISGDDGTGEAVRVLERLDAGGAPLTR
ncbi:glycosyltransferase [uncultured Microbacterium sp.]|uniref:glycosyltransferase n=1 Tax=uncultured Microbacterium sp. TaxID=191216 RepID=UPI0025963F7C|nr:glycosyltransferase [uncultured Microbacterium sp.]